MSVMTNVTETLTDCIKEAGCKCTFNKPKIPTKNCNTDTKGIFQKHQQLTDHLMCTTCILSGYCQAIWTIFFRFPTTGTI